MNAVSPPDGRAIACDPPPDEATVPLGDLALSIQFCRASIMSLTRLQLAFERGDRAAAMEAIDRLHALDVEAERVTADLHGGMDDPRRQAIDRILREEKIALAFEKLALASGIDGPNLASSPPFSQPRDNRRVDIGEPDPENGSPTAPRLFLTIRTYGARAALLLAIGAGTVAIMMTAL